MERLRFADGCCLSMMDDDDEGEAGRVTATGTEGLVLVLVLDGMEASLDGEVSSDDIDADDSMGMEMAAAAPAAHVVEGGLFSVCDAVRWCFPDAALVSLDTGRADADDDCMVDVRVDDRKRMDDGGG